MNHPWYYLTDAEAARLSPPPRMFIIDEAGIIDDAGAKYERLPDEGGDWISIGLVPRPRTRLGWVLHHLAHGLAMRYPVWKVLGFAVVEGLKGATDGKYQ